MANNEVTLKTVAENNTKTKRTITSYEKKLIEILEEALEKRLSSDNLEENIFLYEDMCKAGQAFIENVVLPGYQAKLQSLRLRRPEAADMCVSHIFFYKFDYTMERKTAIEIIKLINTMVENYLEDLWRKEKRHLRGVSIEDSIDSNDTDEEMPDDAETLAEEQSTSSKKVRHSKTATQSKEIVVHTDWVTLSNDCCGLTCEEALSIGDKVVHKKFGLGYYNGTEVIRINGANKRYIKVSYADRDTLFVPVEQLAMVAKYTGNHETTTAFAKAEDKTAAPKALPNVHFEKGWDMVASGENLEDWAVNSDLAFAALTEMKRNANAYEVVSFLETKMVGDKAGNLTYEFANMDQNTVCERVLRNAAKFFDRVIDADFFKDAAFGNSENGYRVNINGNVSHASDRCRNKVLKALKKNM